MDDSFAASFRRDKSIGNPHFFNRFFFSSFSTVDNWNIILREPQWSGDEALCAMLINGEVVLYENANFEKHALKISVTKGGKFGISPGNNAPYHILCYLPGKYPQRFII